MWLWVYLCPNCGQVLLGIQTEARSEHGMTSTFEVDSCVQVFPRKQIGWKRNSDNFWWLLGKLPNTHIFCNIDTRVSPFLLSFWFVNDLMQKI